MPTEETVANEGIDEKEIDTIAPLGEIKEKAEEEKQSTVETSDFDIQDILEELGTPPSEKE